MKSIISGIFCAAFAATAALAQDAEHAAPTSSVCSDISVPKDAVAARGGRWIELTRDQWQFLRGVFVLNPATPPGLPYGDKAVLATVRDQDGGVVFFLDGGKACTPMLAPAVLVKMILDIEAGTVTHEGAGL